MTIDTTFDFYTDANGGDPDKWSPTLRTYHKVLWSKSLPNGKIFELDNKKSGAYLYHKSALGEFYLGSDAITHSYKNQKKKQWLFKDLPEEKINEIFRAGSTIGSYIIFPSKKIDGKYTINQARGIHSYIDDRFDLTLECIRLFYLKQKSPLYDTISTYKAFFDLFENFISYINFFLLNDLVDEKYNVKFYLPFDNFKNKPSFSNTDEYLIYRDGVIKFIKARNNRIALYSNNYITISDATT